MIRTISNKSADRCLTKFFIGNGLPFKILVIYLVVSPFFCVTQCTQNFYEDKKNDQNRPFYMGSRYGRSGQQTKVQVTPRTDRFFMGSRYGKRASGLDLGEIFTPYASNDVQDGDFQKVMADQDGGKIDSNFFEPAIGPDSMHPHLVRPLKCSYLGIGNLYRCFNGGDLSPMIPL